MINRMTIKYSNLIGVLLGSLANNPIYNTSVKYFIGTVDRGTVLWMNSKSLDHFKEGNYTMKINLTYKKHCYKALS